MRMKRRDFIACVAGMAAWPRAARTWQAGQVRRVGVLLLFAASDPEAQVRVTAFENGLRDAGWRPGDDVRIDYRFAAGDLNRMRNLAEELVDVRPDLIVTNAMSPILGARQRIRAIPVVFAMIPNPVDQGLLNSLSDPGENMTGFTAFDYPSIIGKWIELLKAIAPRVARVAIMYNPDAYYAYLPRPPGSYWFSQLTELAPSFAVEPVAMPVHDLAEAEEALAAFAGGPPGGVIVATDTFIVSNYRDIVASARRHRLPGCYPYQYFAAAGGLLSYGPNGAYVFRQVASYVDRILRGAKPTSLPIQRPNKFDLVVNLKTAKTFDLAIPRMLLARADEVIE